MRAVVLAILLAGVTALVLAGVGLVPAVGAVVFVAALVALA